MLEGELGVKLGPDQETVAPAGTLVFIPPMVIHGFRNASADADVKYLNLHAPGCGFADYMRGIRDQGDTEWFDQFDPEGIEGIRPASEIQVGIPAFASRRSRLNSARRRRAPRRSRASARGGAGVESIYVLEGDVEFEFEDREGLAAPGTWLQTPLAAASELSFLDDTPARLLAIRTPAAG